MTTGKTIALTRWTFVGKVMSLLYNMLSSLVIAFLPRSKSVFISWLQSPSAVILEPKKIKGTNRTLCTRTQEKGAVTSQETDPDLPKSVQESPVEAWVSSGLLQGQGPWVCAWELFKEVGIIFITSTIVWPQVKQQGGNTALPINRKLD